MIKMAAIFEIGSGLLESMVRLSLISYGPDALCKHMTTCFRTQRAIDAHAIELENFNIDYSGRTDSGTAL